MLDTKRFDDFRRGSNPSYPGILDEARELSVLRQKAIAGMDRVRAGG